MLSVLLVAVALSHVQASAGGGSASPQQSHKLPHVNDKLPMLQRGQLYICDHICNYCHHAPLTPDDRIGGQMVTEAYYCSGGCKLIKDVPLITIGGRSPPHLGYMENYVPTKTGETSCWGPSPTRLKNDMGFLSQTDQSKSVKVFYPIPAAWKEAIHQS